MSGAGLNGPSSRSSVPMRPPFGRAPKRAKMPPRKGYGEYRSSCIEASGSNGARYGGIAGDSENTEGPD